MEQNLKLFGFNVTKPQSAIKKSMTLLNTTEPANQKAATSQKPRMATLQTLEAKMANIEESLSLSVASRRRQGTSLGSVSSRSSPKLDTILSNNNHNTSSVTHSKEHHQDRESIMQNLRVQLGLEKHSNRSSSSVSVSGPPLNDGEKPVNEQKLSRLRNDADNKKVAIRNLKGALQKLDVNTTLDIDSRIRQAELEYALGREELQLLSIVEEARAIQVRLEKEKSRSDVTSICSLMRNGHQLTLHAVQASTGRWNANQKHDGGDAFYIDWVMDGEELQRGDRILEVNGKILSGRSKDELQKMCANTTRCDLVVIRKRSVSMVNVIPSSTQQNQQQLQQTQADNMRLQHRISYLEEQVKELLDAQKEKSSPAMSNGSQRSGTHITSISISSSPSDHDEDRPMVYQRGSFVTTIVGGKPQEPPPKVVTNSTTTPSSVQKSSSTTNINGHYHHKESSRDADKNETLKSVKSLSSSMSRISISTDLHVQKQRRERERKERDRYYNNKNISKTNQQNLIKNNITASMNQIENSYMKRNKHASTTNGSIRGHDERSIKSLDFESDTGQNTNYDDYASEPVPAPKIRPTPPKKPLRLSLQRARSLQAVCGMDLHSCNTPLMDTINLSSHDKKRATKRIYKGELTNGYSRSIELSPRYIEKYV